MHVIAGKAVCLKEAMQQEFRQYAKAVIRNAQMLADCLQKGGVRVVGGGTENHLVLVDVTSIGLGGKAAERALDHCGITVNMNMIPFDQRKPMDPSGIRIGTPALTTRGMGTAEMARIADWIVRALKGADDAALHQTIAAEVREMASSFPVPAQDQPIAAR